MSNRPKKKIKLHAHGPLHHGYDALWEDVWMRFFVGKRQRKFLAPCLLSRTALERDIAIHKELNNRTMEEKIADHERFNKMLGWSEEKHPFYDVDWTEELEEDEETLRRVKEERFVEVDYGDHVMARIYADYEILTLSLAEEMLEWFLRKHGYIKPGVDPKFQWPSKDSMIIWPT